MKSTLKAIFFTVVLTTLFFCWLNSVLEKGDPPDKGLIILDKPVI